MSADRRVEDFLNQTQGATKKEIMDACGITDRTCDNAIGKVRKRHPNFETRRLPNGERWYVIG